MLQWEAAAHLAHAYIVASASEEVQTRLAQRLAAAMLCEDPAVRPCGHCRNCRKVFSAVHPDILELRPEEQGRTPVYRVDAIRRIAGTAHILPGEARSKVYILHHADAMNFQAQNALLKLLEEPPASAAFILCAANPGALLPTVRSRCELLRENAGDPPEDSGAREAAEAYLGASAAGRTALVRWCGAQKQMEPQALAALLSAARAVLLRQLAGTPSVPALSDAAAAALLHRIERCDTFRRANVNTKHILGFLSVPAGAETNRKEARNKH